MMIDHITPDNTVTVVPADMYQSRVSIRLFRSPILWLSARVVLGLQGMMGRRGGMISPLKILKPSVMYNF